MLASAGCLIPNPNYDIAAHDSSSDTPGSGTTAAGPGSEGGPTGTTQTRPAEDTADEPDDGNGDRTDLDGGDATDTTIGPPDLDTGSDDAADGGLVKQDCDPYGGPGQCPPGQKCNVFARRIGQLPVGAACFSSLEPTTPTGDNCDRDQETIGVDSCQNGDTCWGIAGDPPVCIPLCGGSMDAPTCDNGLQCDSGDFYGLCRACNPLEQGCALDMACYLVEEGTACLVEGDGTLGEPCELFSECVSGLTCVSATVPDCDAAACCTAFCELGGASLCQVPATCTGLNLEAPLQNLGVCILP